jgi:photosystem II stability/assembly factor-like uncharacterized protein
MSHIRALALFLLLAAAAVPARAVTSSWVPLGPFGGSVDTLAVAPSAAGTLYATLGPQGAFRSTDGGVSWTPIHAGTAAGKVAVDPTRPDTIYLATIPGGLQKSVDGGGHWTTLTPPVEQVTAVAVDPVRASRVYIGTSGQRVWRSNDGGVSWQPGSVPGPNFDYIDELALSRTGGILYARSAYGTDLAKSTDAGRTWKLLDTGVSFASLTALAVAPTDPKTLYVSFDTFPRPVVSHSRDGGASWEEVATPPMSTADDEVQSLTVSPLSPGRVWAGTLTSGLFLSVDGGAHWAAVGLPPQERSVPAIAVAPSSPGILYAGVTAQGLDLGGVFASADGGASWLRRNQGLAGLSTLTVAVPPGSTDVIYAGLAGPGLLRSANAGRRWARVVLPGPPPPPYGTFLVDFEIAPSAVSTFYALATSPLWRSTDAGASWITAYAEPDGPRLNFLRVDPTDPLRLWGSPSFSEDNSGVPLLRSTDGGDTWATVPTPGLGCRVADLQIAPSTPATLYVAGVFSDFPGTCKISRPYVMRSTDGGATWAEADGGLSAHSVTALAVDPRDSRLLYVGTRGDYLIAGRGVWKSADGGASWVQAGDALKGLDISAVITSPLPGVVWAASPSVAWEAGPGRVFRSTDGGASWSDLTGGLQAALINQLLSDPADPSRIYAATSGGVWVLEDVAP